MYRMSRMKRIRFVIFAVAASILLGTSLGGVACNRVEIGASMLMYAPNRGATIDLKDDLHASERSDGGVAQAFRVEVGPPAASLYVRVVEPPDAPSHESRGSPRGTILFLHGIADSGVAMIPTAKSLAARGFRGVVVDSRGHGRSSGDFVTFGAQECRDYRQVIDELARRSLLAPPLAVYGASFGAGIAAQLAGRDPRIRTAILLAPFSSMKAVALARVQSLGLGWFFDPPTVERVFARFQELTGCDPGEADAVAAQRLRPTPVLIFHGSRDEVIPATQSEEILRAAAAGSRRFLIPGATHDDWSEAGRRMLWEEGTRWLDEQMGGR